MQAFHNDESIKAKYVARVIAHRKADNLIKGTGWENGKGCAIGCTLENYSHAGYETELGLPEWLAMLEDEIFENLTNGAAQKFPQQILEAIPVGAKNFDKVKWKFCAYILRENIMQVMELEIDEELKTEIVDATRGCLALHEEAIKSGSWNESAARSAKLAAESAAESAARSARTIAWSIAWSAARSAAWSAAWTTARSARTIAWSIAWSARAAVEPAAYERYSDELLRLLREMD